MRSSARRRPVPVRRDEAAPEAERGARPAKNGEVVAAELRRMVLDGRISVGDRLLPEDKLMAHFGVARPTLREGLRILESEGVLEVRRGRNGGPRVTMPAIDRLAPTVAMHLQMAQTTTADLHDARSLIEPFLAGRLAAEHTDDDLRALEEIVAAADTAADAGDRRAFAAAVTQLHETIVARAGGQTLSLFAKLLHELTSELYRHAAKQASGVEEMRRAVRSYRKLVRLVAAGQAKAAEDHWRAQMAYTAKGIDPRARLGDG